MNEQDGQDIARMKIEVAGWGTEAITRLSYALTEAYMRSFGVWPRELVNLKTAALSELHKREGRV